MTPGGSNAANNPFGANSGNVDFANADFPVIAPDQLSADEAYRRGIQLYRSGDRAGAKLAFNQAWQNAAQLNGNQRRQLQDFMQDLATVRGGNVQLASAQEVEFGPIDASEPAAGTANAANGVDTTDAGADATPERDPLTVATQASDVQFDRLRTEVMNSVFRAEKLNDDPNGALLILDNALATVEAAPLSKESLESLAGYIQRSQATIREYKAQIKPNLAREEERERPRRHQTRNRNQDSHRTGIC